MGTYSVQIPVSGSVIVTVEAESRQSAIDAAWDLAEFRVTAINPNVCDPGDFETHEKITKGNVCYAVCNEINVEEIKNSDSEGPAGE